MAPIRLTLEAVPFAGDPLFSGRAEVTGERYAIGRSETCDWVVADPKRLVSKVHCQIERLPGGGRGFRVTDRSTNGTHLGSRALSRGESANLNDGDELRLAGYVFCLAIDVDSGLPNVSSGPGAGLGLGLEDGAAAGTSVTSILQDVAQDDDGRAAALPDLRPDDFAGQARAPDRSTLTDIGWDGPPGDEGDIVASDGVIAPAQRDFIDRSQQVPTERSIVDLPKAAPPPSEPVAERQIIPMDWLDDTNDGLPDTDPPGADAREPVGIRDGAVVIPVENLDLSEDVPAPSVPQFEPVQSAVAAPVAQLETPVSAPARDEWFAAFCDGLGIDVETLPADDPTRLFHNIGLALRIAAMGLLDQRQSEARGEALLEREGAAPAATPWIFSMSGADRSEVASNVARYLAEAEPRDLDAMRRDFDAMQEFATRLPEATIALVERLETALEPGRDEAKSLSTRRKAGRFDALVKEIGLGARGEDAKRRLLTILQEEWSRAAAPPPPTIGT